MKNLSVRTTIIAGLAALAGVSVVSNIAGFIASSNLSDELSDANDNMLPSLTALGDLKSDINDTRGLLGQHVLATTPEALRELDSQLEQQIAAINQELEAFRPMIADDTERANFADIETKWRLHRLCRRD